MGVSGGLLVLNGPGGEIQRFKPFDVDQFVLMGNIDLTNAAITTLLKHGIDCVFLTWRGSYKGRLVGRQSKNILLRVAQFRAMADPKVAGAVAGAVSGARC